MSFHDRVFGNLKKAKTTTTGIYSSTPIDHTKFILSFVDGILTTSHDVESIIEVGTCNASMTVMLSPHYAQAAITTIEYGIDEYEASLYNLQLASCVNVKAMLGDVFQMRPRDKTDIIFADPPWGGDKYDKKNPQNGAEFGYYCNELKKRMSSLDTIEILFARFNPKVLVYKVPANFVLERESTYGMQVARQAYVMTELPINVIAKNNTTHHTVYKFVVFVKKEFYNGYADKAFDRSQTFNSMQYRTLLSDDAKH